MVLVTLRDKHIKGVWCLSKDLMEQGLRMPMSLVGNFKPHYLEEVIE